MKEFLMKFLAWLLEITRRPPAEPEPPPDPDPIPPDPDDDDDQGDCEVKDREGLPPDQKFLWKPIADVGSNAAVVLPAAFSRCPPDTPRVTVYYGAKGKRQASGRWNGSFANGCRMAYRFAAPGASFGKNIRVVARRSDGSTFTWRVPSGAVRYEERFE